MDEEDLLPGQQWEVEIKKAVRRSHVVVVCLSNRASRLKSSDRLYLLDEILANLLSGASTES